MKKSYIILITILLTACCSTAVKKIYYRLPLETNAIVDKKKYHYNDKCAIWVQQILLPDHLAGNGLVYQTNDVEYIITNNNLWANPIVQQLKETMIYNLNKNLPGWFISDIPMLKNKTTNKLNVILHKFQGRYDGKAIISGEWILEYKKYFIMHHFSFIVPQKKDGYDGLISTLSLGWHKVCNQISEEILKLKL
ncbi:membrane integrity-associated transporter subunit PqiC [Pantoea sp. SoEX]|uniref:membrane integrity-associated transporter subunit PqiC n=1 Tax=Pantoea sp. SoEX TaxID=2576763 RepID=UPI00135A2385|nr:membrane integrity-associated transporter subunit PqiC [Pantoea sp. SoEX]MXP51014.1 membrane integrity-associated transporter subunit PqiC [Pantoea sp. SoEX]